MRRALVVVVVVLGVLVVIAWLVQSNDYERAPSPKTNTTWYEGETFCFDGAAHSATKLDVGAWGLREFEVRLEFKAVGCGPVQASAQFHSGGCALVSAVRGSRASKTEWFVERRESAALPPRESLAQPRGNSEEDQAKRVYLEEALSKGSRSDWGVSLSPEGHLLFGIGHRDFGLDAESAGTQRASARPVRDTTVRTLETFADNAWHRLRATRTRRSKERRDGTSHHDPHDTSELILTVDGRRRDTTCAVTGGKTSDAAAGQAARLSGGSPGFGGSAPPHPLVDATFDLALGELLEGCVRKVEILPRPRLLAQPKIPLYFAVNSDNESRAMRDAFVRSIVDDDFDLREHRAGDILPQSERFSTKIDLVLKALSENPPNSLVLVSDLDIRFFKPISKYVRRVGDVDVAFQRDEDRSLQVNLGFMALRCRPAVSDLFRITGDIIKRKRAGTTGDQRIINRALAQPWFYGTPRIRWTTFPSELATNSIVSYWRTSNMYGSNPPDWALFHANDYGRASLAPDRARRAKLQLLADVDLMVKADPRAPPTTKRWPGHGYYKRPDGDLP